VTDHYREAIRQTFAAAEVALPAAALDSFVVWASLLERWNRKIKLTTVTDPRGVAERHLLDASLVAIDPTSGERVVDVGAGAGVPGLPVAILRPDLHVTLVERIAKKVAFLRAAVDALGLPNATVERADLADLAGRGFDRAVSRAVMAPVDWLATARPVVRPGGAVGVMVARREELPRAALEQLRHVTLPSDGADRFLAWVRLARKS
jgi:16S rRNA (guanine527-N7)-methyltransferase